MFFIILVVSFLATLLSSMSGGGSGMITFPVWVMLGFPVPVVLAAAQVNGALWTPIAARNYLKGISIDLKLAFGLIIFGLIGAYFGVLVVTSFNPEVLQRVIGVFILCLVIIALVQKKFGVEISSPKTSKTIPILLALPLGFYESFFGSGNGIFTSTMLIKTQGFNLVTALGYYYLVSFTWCTFASALFLFQGFGSWELILPSSIGALIGAYLGSRIGKSKGSKFVRYVFIVVGGVLGLKLLLGF